MNAPTNVETRTPVLTLSAIGVSLLWLGQPPLSLWPVALFALVPFLYVVSKPWLSRRDYGWLWAAGTVYWLLTLQGLRHAHPALYAGWIALSVYLAIYFPVAVFVCRQLVRRMPMVLAAPIAWVGTECIRNYLLSGVSAAMLGHMLADVPHLIQIADLFGSYGVSFFLVVINVGVYWMLRRFRGSVAAPQQPECLVAFTVAAIAVLANVGYSQYRIDQAAATAPDSLATFVLIQRDEQVDYGQSAEREVEILEAYRRQTVHAVSQVDEVVDAVIWPESMFTGALPWMIVADDAKLPNDLPAEPEQFRNALLYRAGTLQYQLSEKQPNTTLPHLLVGCGVIRYSQTREIYSGLLHISPEQKVDWYGKTHLVMFGEYIPFLPYIPLLKSLVPPGLGVKPGPGPKRYDVNGTVVLPNICIETAVERVTVNQMKSMRNDGGLPDVVATIANDGWFDDSSLIEHHLRCAQFVAIGCRRPILSAANNGPTAWIDSDGKVVERLPRGTSGYVLAKPKRNNRISLYVRIGDWPAKILALVCLVVMAWSAVAGIRRWKASRGRPSNELAEPTA